MFHVFPVSLVSHVRRMHTLFSLCMSEVVLYMIFCVSSLTCVVFQDFHKTVQHGVAWRGTGAMRCPTRFAGCTHTCLSDVSSRNFVGASVFDVHGQEIRKSASGFGEVVYAGSFRS